MQGGKRHSHGAGGQEITKQKKKNTGRKDCAERESLKKEKKKTLVWNSCEKWQKRGQKKWHLRN